MEDEDFHKITPAEALDLLTGYFGTAPISRALAKKWIEDSIHGGPGPMFTIDKVCLYELFSDRKELFRTLTDWQARAAKGISIGFANHRYNHFDMNSNTICLNFFWGYLETTLEIYREYENEFDDDSIERCLAVSEGIWFYREDILWWIGDPAGKKMPEPPAPESRPIGRPRKHDWEGALCHLIAVADRDGLEEPTQADIERKIAEWFSGQGKPEPAESAIREWAQKVMRALKVPHL